MVHDPLGDLLETYQEAWQLDASCRGVDQAIFFPSRGRTPTRAKRICQMCPVREQCLDFALETRQKYGIWGGMNEPERVRERRRRRRVQKAT